MSVTRMARYDAAAALAGLPRPRARARRRAMPPRCDDLDAFNVNIFFTDYMNMHFYKYRFT